MFALSKWVYYQSCQAAKSGALNLQSSLIRQKLAAKAAGKLRFPPHIGKRFPDEVYHRRPARQYASDHSLRRPRPQIIPPRTPISAQAPPPWQFGAWTFKTQLEESHSPKMRIAIGIIKMRVSLRIYRLFLPSFEDNLRHGTPFSPVSVASVASIVHRSRPRHSRLLPAQPNSVQRSTFHADL